MNSSILDAGYYHVKSEDMVMENSMVPLAYVQDTAYIIPQTADHALSVEQLELLKNNGQRIAGELPIIHDLENPAKSYILYRPLPNASLISIDSASVEGKIQKISFAPKKTESATLEYGLREYGDRIDNVLLMVDDLGIKAPISECLPIVLPESYKTLLLKKGFTQPLFVSERTSRNHGAKLSHKHKDHPERHGPFSVVVVPDSETADNKGIAITSDYIKNFPGTQIGCAGVVGAVGLTKPNQAHTKQVPSCGVIDAGYMVRLADNGCRTIYSVYNLIDDEDIGRKLLDGVIITAWLRPDLQLTKHIELITGGSKNPVHPYSSQTITLAEIRGESPATPDPPAANWVTRRALPPPDTERKVGGGRGGG